MSWEIIIGFVDFVTAMAVLVMYRRMRTRERSVRNTVTSVVLMARTLATALEPVVPLFHDLAQQDPLIADAVTVGRLEIERDIILIRRQANAIERLYGVGRGSQ